MQHHSIHTIDHKKVFEALPSLYLLLLPNAPHFTIIDVSDAYLNATMTQRNTILGKGLFEVFPDNPEDDKASGNANLKQSLLTVLQTGKQHSMPVQKYDIPLPSHKGGGFEVRYWNPKNTPILNDRGDVLYLLHQVEDVTAMVQLDEARKNDAALATIEIENKALIIKENDFRINLILNALLKYTTMDFSEKLVITPKRDELDAIALGLNSLIDELENQMNLLTIANENLEYCNKELDSFSYSVSHDLRAPLRSINAYSQILIDDYEEKLEDDGKQVLNVIVRNAHKMGMLIDDLLMFSRIGKQNITKVLLNMTTLVNTTVQELTAQNTGKQTQFVINELQNVDADNSMLKQVLTNLISNAIKYSSKKEAPYIEIGSFCKEEQFVFYIKDNGAGFDMKYYDKLFGVFQRLHSSADFDGTGVGLALVQRIIKKHQGNVWAEAILNEGATFYFSLPISTSTNH